MKKNINSIIKLNVLLLFFIRGTSIGITMLTFPVFINYFEDKEIFGIWMTIISILNWILSFDLGIGNGLRNRLSYAIEKKKYEDIAKYIYSSYFSISIFSVIVIISGYYFLGLVDWINFFNLKNQVIFNKTLVYVVRAAFIGIMIQFLLKLVNSIFFAMNLSFIPGLLNLVSSGTLFLYVFFSKPQSIEINLKNLSKVYILTSNIPLILASLFLMILIRKKINYEQIKFSKSHFLDVTKLGGMFFFVQIFYMVLSNSNELLITKLINPGDVINYQIYYKIFSLIFVVFSLVLAPIWSAITREYAKQNIYWIRKIYTKLNLSLLLVLFSYLFLGYFFEDICKIWLKNNYIQADNMYIFIYIIYGLVFTWASILSTIANGIGKLKIQFICMGIGAILNIFLSILFSKISGLWINIVIANIISFLPYCIMQTISLNKFIKKGSLK